MTDISVSTQQFQAEDLSWDLSNPAVPFVDSGTLDVSLFNQAQHFPNGFIPSGTYLGKKTAGGLLGPYLNAAADGRETCVGVLRHSIQVVQTNGSLKTKIGVAVMKAFGVIKESRLPFTSGTAALGGYVDAAAKADLPQLFHTA